MSETEHIIRAVGIALQNGMSFEEAFDFLAPCVTEGRA